MTSKAFRRTMMACLCIVLAFMYIPIIAIIGMSFNKTPYGMFPYVFTTQWYKTLFTTSNLLPACILSLKFSFLVTLAAVVIGTLCSYGLQYYAPKWAARFNFVLQLPIIIPWLVTSISLLLMFSFLGSGRGMGTMFLGNLIVVLPYVVLLVNGRFQDMDRSPEAAARLLGASPLRVFFDITLLCHHAGHSGRRHYGNDHVFQQLRAAVLPHPCRQEYAADARVHPHPQRVSGRSERAFGDHRSDCGHRCDRVLAGVGFSAGSLFGMSGGAKKKGE